MIGRLKKLTVKRNCLLCDFVMFLEKEESKKQVGQEKCWCRGFKKSKYFQKNR